MQKHQLKRRRADIKLLRDSRTILEHQRGERFYWRALSPEARRRKKIRRRLEKQGRRNARR